MLAEEKVLLAAGFEADFSQPTTSEVADTEQVAQTAIVWADEARLLARLRAGEMQAFEDLVNEFQPLIFALTLRILGNAEDARDATQETFLKIYRHLAHFRGEASLKTWVCKVAINQARTSDRWWRRRRRDETDSLDISDDDRERLGALSAETLADAAASPESQTLSRERSRQLQRALSEVKKDFRIAVVLRDIEGMTYEEIACILEISVGTVKSRIARGREMLREVLEMSGRHGILKL
ncbi:MAG TPA: sigma-70 family RNA polymerase sigma factor [Blastocatellia bacterium]|nr:sigma-70 family RNA polymerase sigma factor [Blastocatellia bacterium]